MISLKTWSHVGFLQVWALLAVVHVSAQTPPTEAVSVVVPESAAKLARPILDLQRDYEDCYQARKLGTETHGCVLREQNQRERQMGKLLSNLTKHKTQAADEALVVLTCFYIGESQEEADAIIERGRRMLPLLKKYKRAVPVFLGHAYPTSMLRTDKQEHFAGLVYAILYGWRGTWDNPEG